MPAYPYARNLGLVFPLPVGRGVGGKLGSAQHQGRVETLVEALNEQTLKRLWLERLQRQRAIAVVRATEEQRGYQMAQTVAAAGMELIEITWNTAGAAALIRQLRRELPHCWIGAGTLLTPDHLQQAIAAGAQFCFSPHVNPDLIQAAIAQGVPMIPGAFSPTEIVSAWQAGASSVKVFPIQALGGVSYLHHLQGPLREIPLIPTGGVTLTNAGEFLAAGAIAVGLSRALFPPEAIAAGNWGAIAQQIQQWLPPLQQQSPRLSSPANLKL